MREATVGTFAETRAQDWIERQTIHGGAEGE